ncbi:MAG: Diguanylate cyclase protein, partial [Pseudonocardiales bacterium]|nr:Diguanylate cyclase protein [Pseudonocardiales bacterium]
RVDGPADAVALAHRVVALLQQPIMIGELRIQLTASVGVAFAGTGTSPETLLSDADAAMYEAKAAGRNRLAVFESQMRERVNHRRAVVNNFEGSLQRGEWLIEYQPQIRLSDGALEGFEALVRWAHPTLGVLTPDQFITLAEETGFIVELGRWILNQSCAQAVSWNAHRGLLSVAVNVSGRQLAESRLIQDVLAALASTGLRPEQLILEITESLLVHDPVGMAAALASIRALGVRIAIDDFGTGYSSLSYLSRLPVDILKIDKSFVDTLMDPGGDSAAFIEIILRLARHLHLVATAEGIEHRQQYDVLKDLRCDSGQGFLLSRPLGRDAALAFAEHYSPASTITTAR